MSEPLKNMYDYESLNAVAIAIKEIYPSFQADEFLEMTIDETWDDLQLKARCRKISTNLGVLLPREYQKALEILEQAVHGFSYAYFFPDFIEYTDWRTGKYRSMRWKELRNIGLPSSRCEHFCEKMKHV